MAALLVRQTAGSTSLPVPNGPTPPAHPSAAPATGPPAPGAGPTASPRPSQAAPAAQATPAGRAGTSGTSGTPPQQRTSSWTSGQGPARSPFTRLQEPSPVGEHFAEVSGPPEMLTSS
jgi:hypothetical protein